MNFEQTSITKAIQGNNVLPGTSMERVTKSTSPEDPRAKAQKPAAGQTVGSYAKLVSRETRFTFVNQTLGVRIDDASRDTISDKRIYNFSRRNTGIKASNDSTGQFNDGKSFHETFMEIVERRQSLPYLPEKLLLSKGQKKEILSIDMHANLQQLSEELQMPFLEARGRVFGAHTGERAVQPLSFPEMWAREMEKQQGSHLSEDQKAEISMLTTFPDLRYYLQKLCNLNTQYMSEALLQPYLKTVEQISSMKKQLPEKPFNTTLRLYDKELNAKEEITIEKNKLSSLSFSENSRLSVEVSTLHSEDHFVCKKIYIAVPRSIDTSEPSNSPQPHGANLFGDRCKPKNHWEKGEREFNILIGTNNVKNILEALPHGYTVENLNLQELSHSDGEKSYEIMLNFKHKEKQE